MPLMPTRTPVLPKVTFGGAALETPAQVRARTVGPTPVAARLDAHPMVERIGNGLAEIFVAHDFVTPEGCARLCELIEAQRRPSTIANSNGDAMFRTSETCDMSRDIPVVRDVQQAIASLTGLPIDNAEGLQGQRYAPGQEFKRHSDYFEPNTEGYRRFCTQSGQRTWTAMAYLSDVEAGGETNFSDLGVSMRPRLGTLLLWNNLFPDGRPNPATMHQASPVIAGVKSIITQWYRERPWR